MPADTTIVKNSFHLDAPIKPICCVDYLYVVYSSLYNYALFLFALLLDVLLAEQVHKIF